MVLVTGSTGFVGRHIVRKLRSTGMEVRCLVRSSSDLSVVNGLDVGISYGDVTNQASLEMALENTEAVVHLVAINRETKQATFEREFPRHQESGAGSEKDRSEEARLYE